MSKTYRQRINYDRLYDMCSKELSANGIGIARVVCPDKRDSASFMSSFERYLLQNDCCGISVFIWKEELIVVSDVHIHTFDEDKTKTHKQLVDECLEYAVKNRACRITFRNRYASTFKTRAFDLERGSVVFCKRRETVYVFDEKRIPTIEAVYVNDKHTTIEEEPKREILTPIELCNKLTKANPVVVAQFDYFDSEEMKEVINACSDRCSFYFLFEQNKMVLMNFSLFNEVTLHTSEDYPNAIKKIVASRKPTIFVFYYVWNKGALNFLPITFAEIDAHESGLFAYDVGNWSLAMMKLESAPTVRFHTINKEETDD